MICSGPKMNGYPEHNPVHRPLSAACFSVSAVQTERKAHNLPGADRRQAGRSTKQRTTFVLGSPAACRFLICSQPVMAEGSVVARPSEGGSPRTARITGASVKGQATAMLAGASRKPDQGCVVASGNAGCRVLRLATVIQQPVEHAENDIKHAGVRFPAASTNSRCVFSEKGLIVARKRAALKYPLRSSLVCVRTGSFKLPASTTCIFSTSLVTAKMHIGQ